MGTHVNTVKLVKASTIEELATFDVPAGAFLRWINFSSDGSHLLVSTNDTAMRILDLRSLRRDLGDLDWDVPDYPPAKWNAAKPLGVKLDITAKPKP